MSVVPRLGGRHYAQHAESGERDQRHVDRRYPAHAFAIYDVGANGQHDPAEAPARTGHWSITSVDC